MSAQQSCSDVVARFLARDLDDWTGLPNGCAEHDIASAVSLAEGEGVVHLGIDMIEYRFRAVAAEGFSEPVRLYFRSGDLRLLRSGLWPAPAACCAALLGKLGEPMRRLDLPFGIGLIAHGAWVYPARGLTLGVIPETGLFASVAAYAPCSADEYERTLHDFEPAREFRTPSRDAG